MLQRNHRRLVPFLALGMLVSVQGIGCGKSDSDTNQDDSSDQDTHSQCLSEANPAPSQPLECLGIATVGGPTTVEVDLPQALTDANWGLKASTCAEGGYDLTPYAGQRVTLTSYRSCETRNGVSGPLDVWLVSRDGNVICVYLAVNAADASVPGIFSVDGHGC